MIAVAQRNWSRVVENLQIANGIPNYGIPINNISHPWSWDLATLAVSRHQPRYAHDASEEHTYFWGLQNPI